MTVSQVVILALLVGAPVSLARAPRPIVTQKEAKVLVMKGLAAIKLRAAVDYMPVQNDPRFYIFEAITSNPDVAAVVGHFAVNIYTGDVWDLAGHCTHISSNTLNMHLANIRHESRVSDKAYGRLRHYKPECDAY